MIEIDGKQVFAGNWFKYRFNKAVKPLRAVTD